MRNGEHCPDCDGFSPDRVSRRQFVQTVGATAALASTASLSPQVFAKETEAEKAPENLVTRLYGTLSDDQKKKIWFPWDHTDERGLLRLHVANNWHITEPTVTSDFFTKDQQEMIEALFFGLYHPDWHDRIKKQLRDDAGGYGVAQSIALFGEPGSGKFEFVMTGRHLTIRCDGDSTEHFAFGGPIFYGHAAEDFDEKPDHPGNVFWDQALKANALYEMLDGAQRKSALVANSPDEAEVHMQGAEGKFPGLAVTELSSDQKEHLKGVLEKLVEPYRNSDRDEVVRCLEAQGGLDKCSIAFYQSDDIGNDGVWDNWRLEGPSFVWYFRGAPHVHVWVNVADNSSVKISTEG